MGTRHEAQRTSMLATLCPDGFDMYVIWTPKRQEKILDELISQKVSILYFMIISKR